MKKKKKKKKKSKRKKRRGHPKPQVSPDVMARDFLGMALEEMRVALTEDSIGMRDVNVYARNKALQSAGMAVELAYKALILGQGRNPVGSGQAGHSIKVLHGQLKGDDRVLLEQRIREIGWPTPAEWCRYMDETVNHVQRRYLMYDPKRQRQGVSFPIHGAASVIGIRCVFDSVFELTDRRIQFRRNQENLRESKTQVGSQELPHGVEVGPLIATINLCERPMRGAIEFNNRTGEIRLTPFEEVGPDDDE